MLLYIAVALGTFVTAAAGDWLEAKFVRAASSEDADAAVRLSIGMYLVSLFGLVCFVKIGMWVAVPEILGLWVGTRLAFRKRRHAQG